MRKRVAPPPLPPGYMLFQHRFQARVALVNRDTGTSPWGKIHIFANRNERLFEACERIGMKLG